jgi:predicted aspartyl protease
MRLTLLLLCFTCGFVRFGQAQHPTVLAAFRIRKEGRIITLPVKVNEKTYEFLLDTGASNTVIDPAIAGDLTSRVENRGKSRKQRTPKR